MTAAYPVKIWLNPPKFWQVTRSMPPADADRLLDEVMGLAERQDLAALRRYSFVELVHPPLWNQHLSH